MLPSCSKAGILNILIIKVIFMSLIAVDKAMSRISVARDAGTATIAYSEATSAVSEKEAQDSQALTPDAAPVRHASLIETMAVASGTAPQQQFARHEFKERATSPQPPKFSAYVYSELDLIAEALPSEVVVTSAYDPKFIVASYGSDSHVILGGYEGNNKIAFVVNFVSVEQIKQHGSQMQHHISTLAKKPIKNPTIILFQIT